MRWRGRIGFDQDAGILPRVLVVLCLWGLLMAAPATALESVFVPNPPPLAGALVAGPYNFKFTGEDFLRLTVFNSLSNARVRVAYRTDQALAWTQANASDFVPTADRLANTWEFSVGDGYLLNVVAFASNGSPKKGQCYAKLEVIRGKGASALVLGAVFAGYITANQPIAWPGSPIEASTSGDGYSRSVTGSGTAPGIQVSETVPTNARWELFAITVSLNTNAAAVNRRPNLTFDDGATRYMRSANPQTLGALDSQLFFWGQGLPLAVNIAAGANQAGLPTDIRLLAGHRIGTTTDNMQAGDQYAPGCVMQLVEWLDV